MSESQRLKEEGKESAAGYASSAAFSVPPSKNPDLEVDRRGRAPASMSKVFGGSLPAVILERLRSPLRNMPPAV